MNPGIELRHLRYFLAVAETENFTRAAERLGVSQPSVSEQVAQLETQLGARLFQRLGKRLQLTEAGERFHQSARVVMRKLEAACSSVGAIAGTREGHVDVGVTPAVHLAWIPQLLARMAREHPGITIEVHEHSARHIETEVEAGRFDVGLGFLSRSSPKLSYEPLADDEFALIVPEGNPLAARTSISLKSVAELPLVMLPDSFDMRSEVDRLFREASVRPRVAFEINTLDATLATVVQAGFPSVLTRMVLVGREALGLRAVRLSGKVPGVEYGIVRSRDAELSPAAEALVREARELAQSLPG